MSLRELTAVPSTAQRAMRFVLVATSAISVLDFGLVDPIALHIVAIIVFAVCAISTMIYFYRDQPRPILAATLLIALAVIIAALRPSWTSALDIPMGDTQAALVQVLLPIALFAGLVQLLDTDEVTVRLLNFLGTFGAIVIAFGLIQHVAFPQTLLFSPKSHYLGSVTVSFVNRNTAATFIGLILLVCTTFAHVEFERLRAPPQPSLSLRQTPNSTPWIALGLWIAASTIAVVALMLTLSRGGVLSTFVALAVLLTLRSAFAGPRVRPAKGRTGVIAMSGTIAGLIVVGIVLGGQVQLRAALLGSDDPRLCILPGLLRLLRDNWVWGTGLGTFRTVFPAYRDSSCGLAGIWDMAHNFYIEGWISLGVAFLPICLAAIGALAMAYVVGLRSRQRLRWAPCLGLSAMVLVGVHSAVDFSLQIPGVALTFTLIAASTVSISLRRRRSSKQTLYEAETNDLDGLQRGRSSIA